MPYTIPACAGKLYRPSNGSEGRAFMAAWCERCQVDAAFQADPDHASGCRIIADTMCLDVSDPDYPAEWTHNDAGSPICTAFTPDDQPEPCPRTPDLFAAPALSAQEPAR